MINKTRLIDEFIELVSVPCPSKDEKQEAELIMAKLRELGLEPEMDKAHEKTGGTCGNVWAYVKGTVPNAPKLLFEAHMDSVAPTTGTKVVRKDGVLYSDGTTTLGGDDKVGVAAMLEAVRALKEDGVAHGDVQLCFTVSEEIGCLGVVNMDQSWIKADYGYCMDIGGAPGEITYAAPKLYDIYVTVKGKAAHAGIAPEEGVNAIMLAADALSKLPAYGRLDSETTFNIGMFNAGVGTNIVCPEAKFVIDMRSLNVPRLEALKDAMMSIGITGMTVSHVLGCGLQKGKPEYYRGVPVETNLLPKVQVDIVVSKVPVRAVIETAKKVLFTGHIGDGKIFVYDVENVVKVRTGEEGYDALQDVE